MSLFAQLTVGNFGVDIYALTQAVEAVSEQYARRYGLNRTDDWFILKLHEEAGELTQAYLARAGQARPKGRSQDELDAAFRAELADVLAHTLLVARHFGIDPVAEVTRKWFAWRSSADDTGTDR